MEDPQFLDGSVSLSVAPRLRDQILSIDARTLELPRACPTRVVAEPTDSTVQRWAEAQRARGAPVQVIGLAPTLRWIPDGQEHQALVPRHALQRILTALDE